MKLLLAEDTRDLNRAVSAVLTHTGYEVDGVYDGQEAYEHLQRESYDGIILDIMMPRMDGLEVLKRAREMGILTPVLLLTAKSEVDDRVEGLDAGADDYLTKPFAMKELLARIRSMTRRSVDYSGEHLAFGNVTLNGENFELRAENSVRLSAREFDLMRTLMLNRGHALSTQYLLGHVWKNEPDAQSDTVWLYISYLRGKLKSVASDVTIAGSRGGSFQIEQAH